MLYRNQQLKFTISKQRPKFKVLSMLMTIVFILYIIHLKNFEDSFSFYDLYDNKTVRYQEELSFQQKT